jgi:periplasmic divalent cation tolerance protein
VKSLHSYSVPEIIGLPITEGASSYLEWLEAMTKK